MKVIKCGDLTLAGAALKIGCHNAKLKNYTKKKKKKKFNLKKTSKQILKMLIKKS